MLSHYCNGQQQGTQSDGNDHIAKSDDSTDYTRAYMHVFLTRSSFFFYITSINFFSYVPSPIVLNIDGLHGALQDRSRQDPLAQSDQTCHCQLLAQ